MSITDWPSCERPREKLLQHGAISLSDAELLAIFLRVGLPGKNAVDLARELLVHFGSLENLFAAKLADFELINGIGEAKYAQMQAVLEMSRRALTEQLKARDSFENPAAVRDFLRMRLRGIGHEEFHALYLDTGYRLIAAETVFKGTLNETRVYPRELARQAIAHNAAAIIVAHNHPSGSAEPSSADLLLTRQLQHGLELLDIKLLDHFIVAAHQVVSLAELGHL
ncbi:DNA repair protein RadC [Chitinibacter bivalviorum]|uniref:DNA repair protein RadC n=1 Tax=Chitinibacter bivalviorum TaxID=2739434 RepID=A0A7H9BGZ7_9NEIS|nr:DNA repair protein RadC [Chitinibacter bivalviorum]QLG87221.1 DNA repair protein RadC [Chitinibacter bivalviorum]